MTRLNCRPEVNTLHTKEKLFNHAAGFLCVPFSYAYSFLKGKKTKWFDCAFDAQLLEIAMEMKQANTKKMNFKIEAANSKETIIEFLR